MEDQFQNCNSSNESKQLIDSLWKIGSLIRGTYKPSQYGKVLIPLTVLRRLDSVLKPHKKELLEKYKDLKGKASETIEAKLKRISKLNFYNISEFDFEKLKNDPNNILENLIDYRKGFSPKTKEVFQHFSFETHMMKLHKAGLLYQVISAFEEIDLSPEKVSNREMGIIFEEVLRQSSEESNEKAGDHYTPRDIVKLTVNLVFEQDSDLLSKKNVLRTIADFNCGTGGFLLSAYHFLKNYNPDSKLELYGQDINDEAYAITCADVLIHGQDIKNIKHGCTLTSDGFKGKSFDYILANPPFGVDWKNQKDFVTKEHLDEGMQGRFGGGLPPVSDSSLLFLQHMISKTKTDSEIGVILPPSSLFRGNPGSGESNIRKYIIENDMLESLIKLPKDLFYGTSINTFIWILAMKKRDKRKNKIQLIDASNMFEKMPKSLGKKRNLITEDQIQEITKIYSEFKENEFSKILDSKEFKITETKKGKELVGYSINFEKYFTIEEKKRSLEEVETDLKDNFDQMNKLFDKVIGA